MSIVNVGLPQTGTGDTLYDAFTKVNAEFERLDLAIDGLANEGFNAFRNPYTIFVATDGDDTANGHSYGEPVRSIRQAVQLANAIKASEAEARVLISIAPGTYTESNLPIRVARDVIIKGDKLRAVLIKPAVGEELKGFFKVDSGFMMWGITFLGHQADSAQTGWVVSFDELADNTALGADSLGAYITASPYFQNCSSITAEDSSGYAPSLSDGDTGGGILVDGEACATNSPIRSIVLDSFTQINMDGVGCKVINDAYAQLVSYFGTFCRYHVLCQTGGQVNLSNGTTDFGTYGLVADGYSKAPIYTAKALRDHYGVRRSELTFTSSGANTLTLAAHSLLLNAPVTVKTATNLPLPPTLTAGTVYYLVYVTANTVKLSATVGGTAITISTAGTYTNLITVINQGELAVFCKEFTANRVGSASRPGNGVLMFPQLTFPRTGSLAADATSKGTVDLVEQVGDVHYAIATLDTAPAVVGKHEYVSSTGTVTVTRTGIFVDPEGNTIETTPVLGLNTYTFNVSSIDYNHLTGYTKFSAVNYLPSALDEFYFTDCKFICQLSAYTVTSAEPINEFGNVVAETANPYGYRVNLFNATNGGLIHPIELDAVLDFRRRSQISAPAHVFEYVGSGVDYSALPENGGVPVQQNGYQELNNGRVFITWTNEKGDFAVSNRFLVDGTTGEVTISASSFNLSGLNQIGPFSRNGGLSTVGVAIKEASDNINMISSLGVPDSQTVPTQTAIVNYVSQSLSTGIPNGAVVGGTAFYFSGFEPYPATRIDSTPIIDGDILWDKAKKTWVSYNGSVWSTLPYDGHLINGVAHFVRTTAPTLRRDGSALVTGDRWYNPNTGVEGFWRGVYWLTTQTYHTVDRTWATTTDPVATPGLRYLTPSAGSENVFVEKCWLYRTPGGLNINSGTSGSYYMYRWGYHNVNTTSFSDIHQKESYLIDNPVRYAFDINAVYSVTGFNIVGTSFGLGMSSYRAGITYRIVL